MDFARRAGDGLAASDDEFLGDGAAGRGDADEVGTRREGADVERGAVARDFPLIHLHAGGVVDLYPLQPEAGEHLHPLCRRVGLQRGVSIDHPEVGYAECVAPLRRVDRIFSRGQYRKEKCSALIVQMTPSAVRGVFLQVVSCEGLHHSVVDMSKTIVDRSDGEG